MKKLLLFALSGLLAISATDKSAQEKTIENERLKIHDKVVERLGIDEAKKIKFSEEVEKESKKYIAELVKYNDDGTISFDKRLKEHKEEVYFAKEKEQREQFEIYVDFVVSSAEIANTFVSEGYGYFDEGGNFVPKIDENDVYAQQSFAIWDFKYNVFSGWHFVISDTITSIAGWAGVLVNSINILGSFSNIYSATKNAVRPTTIADTVKALFGKLVSPSTLATITKTITKVISNKFPANTIIAALWGGITIASMFLTSNPYGWVAKIILTVLSLYLPSLFKGVEMGCAGFAGHTTTVNIGYWWSTYDLH